MKTKEKKTENWCYHCEVFRSATWANGPVAIEGSTPVKDVLRATCDVCGTVIALSPEATPKLRKALGSAQPKFRTTIRVQRDIAAAVSSELSRAGIDPTNFDVLIRGFVMYLLASPRNWKSAVEVLKAVDDPVLARPVNASITLRLPPRVWNLLEELEDDTGIQSSSELVRRMLVVICKDWEKGTAQRQKNYIDVIRHLAMVS